MNLAPYEQLLTTHESEVRAYGSFERLKEYLDGSETRLFYYIARVKAEAEAKNKGKPLSATKLRQIETEQEKYVYELLDQKIKTAVHTAINHVRLQTFLSDVQKQFGSELIGTGEAAKLADCPTEDCRASLHRLHKRGAIRGVCFENRLWYWERSTIEQFAKDRIARKEKEKQKEQEKLKEQLKTKVVKRKGVLALLA